MVRWRIKDRHPNGCPWRVVNRRDRRRAATPCRRMSILDVGACRHGDADLLSFARSQAPAWECGLEAPASLETVQQELADLRVPKPELGNQPSLAAGFRHPCRNPYPRTATCWLHKCLIQVSCQPLDSHPCDWIPAVHAGMAGLLHLCITARAMGHGVPPTPCPSGCLGFPVGRQPFADMGAAPNVNSLVRNTS